MFKFEDDGRVLFKAEGQSYEFNLPPGAWEYRTQRASSVGGNRLVAHRLGYRMDKPLNSKIAMYRKGNINYVTSVRGVVAKALPRTYNVSEDAQLINFYILPNGRLRVQIQ